jgi:hypothetical protein
VRFEARGHVERMLNSADAIGGVGGLIGRGPMTAFLVLTFTLAYPLMALPVLAARELIPDGWMVIAPDEMAGALLTLGALLPAT